MLSNRPIGHRCNVASRNLYSKVYFCAHKDNGKKLHVGSQPTLKIRLNSTKLVLKLFAIHDNPSGV